MRQREEHLASMSRDTGHSSKENCPTESLYRMSGGVRGWQVAKGTRFV